MLFGYNKSWAPYDEGFILEASYMVNKGLVPYRDFFILLYPPGQIYAIAALLKVFEAGLLAARIYTVFMQSIICACVFCIIRKLASLKYAIAGFILCLSALAFVGGSIPRPMWPGIAFSLVSTLFILNFVEDEKKPYLLFAGLFAGLTFLFRHDIGFLTFLSGSIGLLVLLIYKFQNEKNIIPGKITVNTLKAWVIYAAFPAVFIAAVILWLYKINALSDAFQSLLVFPAEFCKGAAIPFPEFCFDFKMILHGGCYFIRKNQFYIPIIMNIVTAALIFTELISKRKLDKRIVSLIILLCLGVFYLQQMMVRTDTVHLAAAFAPSAVLFGVMFTYKTGYRNIFFRTAYTLIILFMSLLMALYFYRNTERYFKDTYAKAVIKKTIKPVAFKQGTLYVPDDGRDMLLSLMKYVENNTGKTEKIYIGSLNHSVPQYGWYELIYFLTERLPAVKYYEIHPGLQDKADIQEEMILSLRQNRTRILLLRDYKSETKTLGPLDKYIRKEYRLDKVIDSYHIYVKK